RAPLSTLFPYTTLFRSPFGGLSRSPGWVPHVLLTRSPLGLHQQAGWTSFDLHALSTPPAFVLSQDQTLHRDHHRTEVRWRSVSRSEEHTSELQSRENLV